MPDCFRILAAVDSANHGHTTLSLTITGNATLVASQCVTVEMCIRDRGYCELLAARVTGKPLEFFQRLPARDAIALKSKIVGFLYGGDGNN